MQLLNQDLILASKSPRRKQLLEQAGFRFEVKSFDVEETYPEDLPLEEVAEFLAKKKADAARYLIEDQEIILAADSVVILEGVLYGKPADEQEAKSILSALSGKRHTVITGICLLSKNGEYSNSGYSEVYLDPISEEEIDYYVKKYQPYDKAGAYAIQEWIGLCKISKIEGTYPNIMGLPVDLVYKGLQELIA